MRHIEKRGHTTLTCQVCGNEFTRPNAHIRSDTHSCSRACAQKIRFRKPKTMLQGVCKHCGKSFQRRKGHEGTMEYCSISCATKATTPKGADHPNWSGGKRWRTFSSRSAIRDKIKEIGKCEECGSEDNLQGHHIVPHAERPDLASEPSNIQILCVSCHATKHPNLKFIL